MELEPRAILELWAKNVPLKKLVNALEKEDRMRRRYPEPELTLIEANVLAAIADGRVKKELETAINLYAAKHDYKDSYNAIVRRLMAKFEAFTIAHVVYKAMKVGIIE